MALNASVNWYVRAGGNALNGGGWDPLISGAGTNYADADAAVLSLTDLATSGAVATVTSATGGFTAAMVGNCLRIASGTNFTAGYYFIVTFTDANTIVLDRACATAAGSGGTGRIGGAFATPWGSLSNGGNMTAPTLATPLAAGHTIRVRGSGSDDPGSADYTASGYATFPAGSDSVGAIRLIGYNGRPKFAGPGLIFQSLSFWDAQTLGFVVNAATYATYGIINSAVLRDIRVDQAGYDVLGLSSSRYYGCELRNSGSTASGTNAAMSIATGVRMSGCKVNGWRGPAAWGEPYSDNVTIEDCVFANCKSSSKAACRIVSAFSTYNVSVRNCAFYGNAYDGLSVSGNTTFDATVAASIRVFNNVFVSNGGYGFRCTGTLAVNDRIKSIIDHNAFYNNTSGAMYLLSAGDHDITLTADPFIDAANGDLRLNATAGGGAALKNVAFPTGHPAA